MDSHSLTAIPTGPAETSPKTRRPHRDALFNSAEVGVFAAIAGTFVPLFVGALVLFISAKRADFWGIAFGVFITLLVLMPIGFILSIVPGMLGGTLLGPLVFFLARRLLRPSVMGMLLGLVIAGAFGSVSSIVFWSPPFLAPVSIGSQPAIAGTGLHTIRDCAIAALVGGAIGWRLGIGNRSLPVFSDQFTTDSQNE